MEHITFWFMLLMCWAKTYTI